MININAFNRSVVTCRTLQHIYNDDNVKKISFIGVNKELYVYRVTDTKGNKYIVYSPKYKEGSYE